LLDYCKFHIIKDERLVSKMEGMEGPCCVSALTSP